MNDPNAYPLNARVAVYGHGGWPDGTTGTIVQFPEFVRNMCSEPPGSPDEFLADGLIHLSRYGMADSAMSALRVFAVTFPLTPLS